MVSSPSPVPAAAPVPPWARRGLAELCRADPDLARVRRAAGPLPWRVRDPGFAGLLRAICGQMISNQAATAIWNRLAALPGATRPDGLLLLDEAALRGAGLSRPKVAHVRALAAACLDGRLDFAAIASLDDRAAVAAIARVPGIGPWTAEVHLLFGQQRRDIFPAGDLALAAAVADLKALLARPSQQALAELALGWRPWRSLAARLLWHHWRHVTGRAAGEAP